MPPEATPLPSNPPVQTPVPQDPVSLRVEWYVGLINRIGLPMFLIGLFAFWARPWVDEILRGHGKFLQDTTATQARQAETLETQTKILGKLEETATEHGVLLRDIRDTVGRRDVLRSPEMRPSDGRPTVSARETP